MKIRIKSDSGRLPSYESREAAGMDIRAYLKEDDKEEAPEEAPAQADEN